MILEAFQCKKIFIKLKYIFSYINRRPRTGTVSTDSFVPPDPSLLCRRRSSSFALGSTIHYKTIRETESKGVWDTYQTREEFMTMHFR